LQAQITKLSSAEIVSISGDTIGQIRPLDSTVAKPAAKDTFTFTIDGPDEEEEEELEESLDDDQSEELKFDYDDTNVIEVCQEFHDQTSKDQI